MSIDYIKKNELRIWEEKDNINGIDLNKESQLELLNKFRSYYKNLPFSERKSLNRCYYYDNEYYGFTDGLILYSMIRHFKPRSIIEVGSGFSSGLMVDVNNLFFKNEILLTFIDPDPKRLFSTIAKAELKNLKIIDTEIQNIDLDIFRMLKSNDILFIDSSHVVKTGHDVNYIIFQFLPVLNPGVLIHFHDVLYPFEYPKKWVFGGRNWNEVYFLRSFLMFNKNFEIIFFSDYLHKYYNGCFTDMPLTKNDPGANLWIRKLS